MPLPEEIENQRLANIDRIGITLPLEVDSNHDLETNFFQLGSAIPHQHQLVTPRQR